jgi:thymidylate synthase
MNLNLNLNLKAKANVTMAKKTEEKRHPEYAYLDVLRQVMEKGETRSTRNGHTKSLFSLKMDFPLRDEEDRPIIPLLTTKKVFWKGVVNELLWFLRGETDSRLLAEEGVKIWDGNSSRAALDARGLEDYEEGDCGPIYGYQWRHFGASYRGPGNTPLGEGVDQWLKCVDLLKSDPSSRRIFMSAWNPVDLEKMCLPPCHVSYQFYVQCLASSTTTTDNGMGSEAGAKGRLCCLMNQRSADLFLGVPFNIASVSLMTHIMAHLTGLEVGSISIVVGDAHIYEEHWGVVEEQLSRTPIRGGFPHISIENRGQRVVENFVSSDFVLSDYQCHGTLTGKMMV